MSRGAQLVVVVNGPAGVGKSSIAPRIASRAANAACIGGDELKRFVISRAEPPTVELGLTYVAAAALTDVFLAARYGLVVVDFVFEHPRHIRRYADALSTAVEILPLTLWAPLEVVQRRHERRGRPGRRGDGAARSWHAIAEHLDELGAVVDASGTIEETLTAIASHIDHRAGGRAREPGADH